MCGADTYVHTYAYATTYKGHDKCYGNIPARGERCVFTGDMS